MTTAPTLIDEFRKHGSTLSKWNSRILADMEEAFSDAFDIAGLNHKNRGFSADVTRDRKAGDDGMPLEKAVELVANLLHQRETNKVLAAELHTKGEHQSAKQFEWHGGRPGPENDTPVMAIRDNVLSALGPEPLNSGLFSTGLLHGCGHEVDVSFVADDGTKMTTSVPVHQMRDEAIAEAKAFLQQETERRSKPISSGHFKLDEIVEAAAKMGKKFGEPVPKHPDPNSPSPGLKIQRHPDGTYSGRA